MAEIAPVLLTPTPLVCPEPLTKTPSTESLVPVLLILESTLLESYFALIVYWFPKIVSGLEVHVVSPSP